MASTRKKIVLFPPVQTFPTNVVSIAAGGITAGSFAPNAISASAMSQGAADKPWNTAVRSLTDKAGFSLTAGSYSIHASNMQRAVITVSGAVSATAAISSVTTTRTNLHSNGFMSSLDNTIGALRCVLTSAVLVTASKWSDPGGSTDLAFEVEETF